MKFSTQLINQYTERTFSGSETKGEITMNLIKSIFYVGGVVMFLSPIIGTTAPKIDVMFVFGTKAYTKVDRNAFADTVIGDANSAIMNTSRITGSPRFNKVYVHNTAPVSFTSSFATTPDNAVNFIRDNTEVKNLRNQYYADIVVMVIDEWNEGPSVCGGAYPPPSSVGTPVTPIHKDTHAFVVFLDTCQSPQLANPHELSHVLFAEHEKSVDETDGNTSVSQPRKYNHAQVDPVGGYATLMREESDSLTLNRYSDSLDNFPNGESAGTTEWANVRRLINKDSWTVVANYRVRPQPSNPTISNEFIFCTFLCSRVLVSWAPGGGGGPVDFYRVEYRINGIGPWYFWYQGSNLWKSFSADTLVGHNLRIMAMNDDNESDWVEDYFHYICGNPPPPF